MQTPYLFTIYKKGLYLIYFLQKLLLCVTNLLYVQYYHIKGQRVINHSQFNLSEEINMN